MTSRMCIIASLCVLPFTPAIEAWLRPGDAQPPASGLEQLNVPSSRLPDGCRVAPSPSVQVGEHRVRVGLWGGLPIQTNPWHGDDNAIAAAVLQRVGGGLATADAPIPEGRMVSRQVRELASGVADTYAAFYEHSEDSVVGVLALRFKSTDDADRILSAFVQPRTPRLLRRAALVLRIESDASECARAVTRAVLDVWPQLK